MNELQQNILSTLLYYDIFSYPLTLQEVFMFLPVNTVGRDEVRKELSDLKRRRIVREHHGYYVLASRDVALIRRRREMELRAHRLWKIARFMTSLIKCFPFVRAVFVSGDLSKNVSDKGSDIDFLVITRPKRLWITRACLVLFKKIALGNRRKFFCINYYLSEDALEIRERDVYVATEIAHLKPLHNYPMYAKFMRHNVWIKQYYPNYAERFENDWWVNDRASLLQKLLELPFLPAFANRFDYWLMKKMETIWKNRYPHLSDEDRCRLFRCEPHVSTAHGGDFQKKVMGRYRTRLRQYGLLE